MIELAKRIWYFNDNGLAVYCSATCGLRNYNFAPDVK